MTALPRTWIPSFLALAFIWGCSFAFVEIGLRALSPVQVAFSRIALGALALSAIALATRTRLPGRGRVWLHLTVVGALLSVVPFTLFAFGQQYVSSILAGLINAATPLATMAVVLAAYPEESPSRERIVGLLTGFAGVAVVIGFWKGFTGGEWGGILACLAAITCYGIALPYARRHLVPSGYGHVALSTAQQLVATALMVPVLLVAGTRPDGPITVAVVLAMLALGVLGSGIAYVLNYRVVATAGPTTASTVTYLIPLVATAVGIVFLGEDIGWNEPVGGLVVLAGVTLANGHLRRRAKAGTGIGRE